MGGGKEAVSDDSANAAAADDDDDKRPAARQTGKSKKIAATESEGQGGTRGGLYLKHEVILLLHQMIK